jgi:hypothetical protein
VYVKQVSLAFFSERKCNRRSFGRDMVTRKTHETISSKPFLSGTGVL